MPAIVTAPPPPAAAASAIKVEDASTKGGFRIAGRRLVSCYLHSCLALDSLIACFDIHVGTARVALCTGRIIHMWSTDRNAVIFSLGKAVGHRADIRCCVFNPIGTVLLTGGEDGRVILWNLAKQRTERIIQAHIGNVYSVRYCSEDRFLSCGDDGKVILWEPGPGTTNYSTVLQHPSTVRSFAFSDVHDDRLVAGRTDGVVDTWSLPRLEIIDSIRPESDWQERELLSQLGGPGQAALLALLTTKNPGDPEHHSGSLLHLSLAPNSLCLATCSTDNTCKLWNVGSYMTDDPDFGKAPAGSADPTLRVNVWDEPGLEGKDVDGELHVGTIDMRLGYHADLVWTLKHENPVVCAVFTAQSDMVITSSLDCTIRFWSVRKGNLLFQINTPAPARHLIVDSDNYLFAIAGIRMLKFSFKAGKEKDVLAEMEELRSRALEESTRALMQPPDPASRFKSLLAQERDAGDGGGEAVDGLERFTMAEVRSLLAQGSLMASSLDTLLEDNSHVDASQLRRNMALHDVKAGAIIKAIVQNNFLPTDMLHAFAAADLVNKHAGSPVGDLYGLLKRAEPVREFLIRAGLRPASQQGPRPVFPLKFQDFRPFRSLDNETPDRGRVQRMSLSALDDDEEDGDGDGGLGGSSGRRSSRPKSSGPRGHLLHYIPSEAVTRERLSSEGRPRLRKLYLEPSSTRPPTTPLRFTQVTSRENQLFLGNAMGGAGGARAADISAATAHMITQWTSSGPQRVPAPPPRHASFATGVGQPATTQYRGQHYRDHFADNPSSTFLHPLPGDAALQGAGYGGGPRGRQPRRQQPRASSLPPPAFNPPPQGGALQVQRFFGGRDVSDADLEDYDEDEFDYSMIDKMADAVLVSDEALDTSGTHSHEPHVVPGQVRIGHIYAQPMVIEHEGNSGESLAKALRVGRPVQVRSQRARPAFTN
ncbi:hypothetical protein H9P43_007889 [Blastocladiella emersonii ATCC 22665]|nr:hypothetical protein H9P43_007889 [Blastocladiella emersonii ATCC 22665]